MGVFTIYCCVCGGPSMDLTDWVKDRVAQEPKFVFGGRRMRWLMRSLAITAHGMIKGICDDYGVLEGVGTDSGRLVCVTVCNWVRSGCDLHIQSTGQQQIDGVLIHKLCWDQHLEPLLGSIGSDALFELLCARSNDRCDFGFDQGEIQKNQGQDYELLEGEGWMVSNPVCSGRVDGATSGSIAGLVPGSLHVIPAEVFMSAILLKFCDAPDLLGGFGSTCRSARFIAKHERIWKHHKYTLRRNSTFCVFEDESGRRNFERIDAIAREMANTLLAEHAEKTDSARTRKKQAI
jgi:hypothetical protein